MQIEHLVFGATIILWTVSCGDSDAPESSSETGPEGTSETRGTTSGSPGTELVPLDIQFVGMWGDALAACDTTYLDSGIGSHAVALVDARVYLSNLVLVRGSGETVPITLTDDDAWQSGTTVLLDYENATGRCSAANTRATNDRVRGFVPPGPYEQLRFDVGVPAAENHIDSTLADPPLNESAMFWTWRDGFIFMRVDLSVDVSGTTHDWYFHLGSTGAPCDGAGGPANAPPQVPCDRPSRPSIELDFDPWTDVVRVDLAALVSRVDLGAPPVPDTANPRGCQSFDFDATDDACRLPFAALGLDVATGDCAQGCSSQTVFSSASPSEGESTGDPDAPGRGPNGPTGTPWTWELPEGFPPPFVPEDNPVTVEKVALGRHLFYDSRLSFDETLSCSTCHRQSQGFADGRATPHNSQGAVLPRNAQGLANVGYMHPLTWANPLLETLEQQILVPLLSVEPIELGVAGHEDEVLQRFRNDALYLELFGQAFPEHDDPFTMHNVVQALASFLRALVSLDSPYDRYYYGGDTSAMSQSALRGSSLFFSERLECHHCHGGFAQTQAIRHSKTAHPPLAWHNTGLYNLDGSGAYPYGNRGVYEITRSTDDMGAFRPPSLRNVAVTGPYMHDGSVETLDEVLRVYERGGRLIESGPLAGDGALNPHKNGFIVGFELTEDERADMLAFFDALTDTTFLSDPRWADPWTRSPRPAE